MILLNMYQVLFSIFVLFIDQFSKLQDNNELFIILFVLIVQDTKWESTTCPDQISLFVIDNGEKSLETSFLSAIAQGRIFNDQDKLTVQSFQSNDIFLLELTLPSIVKNKDWRNQELLSIFNSVSNAFQIEIKTKAIIEKLIHKNNHFFKSIIYSLMFINLLI